MKMTKKLPFQISLEDLLSQLEHSTENPSLDELISYTNDVPYFLSKFKLEAGDHFVRPSLLYKLYKIYSQNPLLQYEFSLTCGNFVPREGSYFKLNISPIKLTKILNPVTNHNQLSSASIKKHYEVFIEVAKITKGSKWVEGFMLYELYRFYCIDTGKAKRMRYENFVTISKLYFEHKRIGSSKGRWFKLDSQVLSILTPEHQEKVHARQRMDEKGKLKRKPKKEK